MAGDQQAADRPHAGSRVGTTAGPVVAYRYEAPDGRIVLVDALEKLPPHAREAAQRIDSSAEDSLQGSYTVVESVRSEIGDEFETNRSDSPWDALPEVDGASFGLGLGVGCLIAAVMLRLSVGSGRFARRLLGVALVCGMGLLATGAYLGYLRNLSDADSGSSPLATPEELIREAREAVGDMNQRERQREAQIEKLRELAR